MATITHPTPVAPTTSGARVSRRAGRARDAVIVAAIVVGAAVTTGLVIWHPEPGVNDEFTYGIVAPIRDAWWAWHLFGGMAMAVLAVAAGIAVCRLVTARGSGWATAGAVMTAIGGVVFGVGAAAEGVLMAYVTDPDMLSADAGTAAMNYINDNPERFLIAILPGLVLLTLGPVLLSVGLWQARAVPRWLPVTIGVSSVAGFVAPFGPVAATVNLFTAASLLAVAWFFWRG